MKNTINNIAAKISYNEACLRTPTKLHIKYVTENIEILDPVFSDNPDMEIEVDKYLDWEELQNN